jgi:sialate O-acetylesterase
VAAIQFEARGQGSYSLRLGQEDIKDGDSYGSESFAVSSEWQTVEIPLANLKQGGWGEALSFTPQAIQTLDFAALIPQVPELPGLAFNGMIAPLQGLRIRGVLWYQGEANLAEGKDYAPLLEALIASWRRLWADAKLPFYVVQLPNFGNPCPAPCESAWASLREAQRRACQDSSTTLVTSIDLGDPSNIHPKDKVRLAERLARAAEVQLYGKKGEALGPRFASLRREGSRLVLRCSGGLLRCADGQAPRGFCMAGADGRYYEAQGILQERTLELSSAAVPLPQSLRYDWADNPDGNLVDEEGLPLTPFEAPLGASGR